MRGVVVAAEAVAVAVERCAKQVGQAPACSSEAIMARREISDVDFKSRSQATDVRWSDGERIGGVVNGVEETVRAGPTQFPEAAVDRRVVHCLGEGDLEAVQRPPKGAAVGRERIDGRDFGWDIGCPFHDHRPTVQRASVQHAVVGDLEGPRALRVQPVDRRKGLLRLVAAVEGRCTIADGGVGFVVENGDGEILAACTHVGEQLDPGTVGGDEIDVQVSDVGVRDVELEVDVGDRERLVDGDG